MQSTKNHKFIVLSYIVLPGWSAGDSLREGEGGVFIVPGTKKYCVLP